MDTLSIFLNLNFYASSMCPGVLLIQILYKIPSTLAELIPTCIPFSGSFFHSRAAALCFGYRNMTVNRAEILSVLEEPIFS